mmetsp:Transcript_11416/g.70068  ORF Transcript_11416/g.70068 Transcript_11416/m.70068 type:complete len:236 (+) Transcript_11416:1625-2332(+)
MRSLAVQPATSGRFRSRWRLYSQQNWTTSTGMASLLPPSPSTSLVSSTMQTNLSEANSTIFSRSSAPPLPLTRLRSGSTSSAPSMATSSFGCVSSVASGIPSASACSFVRSDVGTPTMFCSSPDFSSSPIRSTAKAAVEPVPRPTTMPLFTYSTAFHAACFLSSSWLCAAARTDMDLRAPVVAREARKKGCARVNLACMAPMGSVERATRFRSDLVALQRSVGATDGTSKWLRFG